MSVDPATIVYDGHGNATQVGSQSWSYDGADRVTGTSTSGIAPSQTVSYVRDVLGRVASRSASGVEASTVRYGFTGTGDSPDLLLTAGGAVVERYVSLPGGVLHRKGYAVGATGSWSVSNLHGDVIATVSGGVVTAGCVYDPFGQPLNPASGVVDTTAVPATRAGTGTTDGWAGVFQRGYEHTGGLSQTLMGARTYLPALGMFTATDPVAGGNTTTYTYPQDPINHADYTGTMTCLDCGGGFLVHSGAIPIPKSKKKIQTKSDGRYYGPVTSPQLTLNGVWAFARFIANLPMTTVGTTIAVANGGSCGLYSEGLVGCTGATGGFGRGGTTYGNTFVTSIPAVELATQDRLRAHGLKHSDQWAMGGPLFALEYLSMESRYPGASNPFEVWAGLGDGGYAP